MHRFVFLALALLVVAPVLAQPAAVVYLPTVTKPVPNTVFIQSESQVVAPERRTAYGEVVNGTAKPVYDMRLVARWYDAAGALVLTTGGAPHFYGLLPGQSTVFDLVLSEPPEGIVRVALTVTWKAATWWQPRPVTVASQEEQDERIVGTIRNDQSETIRVAEVVATRYDDTGRIVGVTWNYAELSTLAPGDIVRYRLSVPAGTGRIVVQAEGYVIT